MQENSVGEQETKVGEEGVKRFDEKRDSIRHADETVHQWCIRLWREYKAGRITAGELEKYLGGYAVVMPEVEAAQDVFDAEVL